MKKWAGFCAVLFLTINVLPASAASPWTTKPRYRDRAEGKFVFGLKHTLFSWMTPWAEAHDPKYETQWTGFSVGIGKAFVYTAAGMIQLVTFPITIDFPDIGLGMHIPANHPNLDAKKSAAAAAAAKAKAATSVDSAAALPASAEKKTTAVAVTAASTAPVKAPAAAAPPEETSTGGAAESAPEPEQEPESEPTVPRASTDPAKSKLIK